MVYHSHFPNKLKLFAKITDKNLYELTIACCLPRLEARFCNVSNLNHPNTIDWSFAHDGAGPVPAIVGAEGGWDLRGEVGDELPEWAHDAQGPFVAPFDRCDGDADMAQAYEHFSKLLGGGGGAS